jgi:hypothetical protein
MPTTLDEKIESFLALQMDHITACRFPSALPKQNVCNNPCSGLFVGAKIRSRGTTKVKPDQLKVLCHNMIAKENSRKDVSHSPPHLGTTHN